MGNISFNNSKGYEIHVRKIVFSLLKESPKCEYGVWPTSFFY